MRGGDGGGVRGRRRNPYTPRRGRAVGAGWRGRTARRPRRRRPPRGAGRRTASRPPGRPPPRVGVARRSSDAARRSGAPRRLPRRRGGVALRWRPARRPRGLDARAPGRSGCGRARGAGGPTASPEWARRRGRRRRSVRRVPTCVARVAQGTLRASAASRRDSSPTASSPVGGGRLLGGFRGATTFGCRRPAPRGSRPARRAAARLRAAPSGWRGATRRRRRRAGPDDAGRRGRRRAVERAKPIAVAVGEGGGLVDGVERQADYASVTPAANAKPALSLCRLSSSIPAAAGSALAAPAARDTAASIQRRSRPAATSWRGGGGMAAAASRGGRRCRRRVTRGDSGPMPMIYIYIRDPLASLAAGRGSVNLFALAGVRQLCGRPSRGPRRVRVADCALSARHGGGRAMAGFGARAESGASCGGARRRRPWRHFVPLFAIAEYLAAERQEAFREDSTGARRRLLFELAPRAGGARRWSVSPGRAHPAPWLGRRGAARRRRGRSGEDAPARAANAVAASSAAARRSSTDPAIVRRRRGRARARARPMAARGTRPASARRRAQCARVDCPGGGAISPPGRRGHAPAAADDAAARRCSGRRGRRHGADRRRSGRSPERRASAAGRDGRAERLAARAPSFAETAELGQPPGPWTPGSLPAKAPPVGRSARRPRTQHRRGAAGEARRRVARAVGGAARRSASRPRNGRHRSVRTCAERGDRGGGSRRRRRRRAAPSGRGVAPPPSTRAAAAAAIICGRRRHAPPTAQRPGGSAVGGTDGRRRPGGRAGSGIAVEGCARASRRVDAR